MILEASECRAIDAGKKTQLRRVVVGGDPRYRRRSGRRGASRELVKPWRPRVGDRLPVKSAQNKPVVCRVQITSFRREQHGAISFEDARREGHRTRDAYKAAWVRFHDREWIAAAEIDATADATLVARFDARWSAGEVWVIDFDVVRDPDRYLAANPGAVESDYVTSPKRAAAGEPPAVDDATLALYAKQNAEKPKVTQMQVWAERRAVLEAEIERMERELGEAGSVGRNLGTSIRALRRQLDIVESKLRRSAA